MRLVLTYADPEKKIQAIKNIRAATNSGLKEAKDAADSVVESLRAGRPTRYSLNEGLPREAAEAALVELRDGGYADGFIEIDANDGDLTSAQKISLILLIQDAIAAGRIDSSPDDVLIPGLLDRHGFSI